MPKKEIPGFTEQNRFLLYIWMALFLLALATAVPTGVYLATRTSSARDAATYPSGTEYASQILETLLNSGIDAQNIINLWQICSEQNGYTSGTGAIIEHFTHPEHPGRRYTSIITADHVNGCDETIEPSNFNLIGYPYDLSDDNNTLPTLEAYDVPIVFQYALTESDFSILFLDTTTASIPQNGIGADSLSDHSCPSHPIGFIAPQHHSPFGAISNGTEVSPDTDNFFEWNTNLWAPEADMLMEGSSGALIWNMTHSTQTTACSILSSYATIFDGPFEVMSDKTYMSGPKIPNLNETYTTAVDAFMQSHFTDPQLSDP